MTSSAPLWTALWCLALLPSGAAFVSHGSTTRSNMASAAGRTGRAPRAASVSMALPRDKLLSIAQEYLDNPSPDKWSEDYVFRGPVIGPLAKKDIIATLGSVAEDMKVAFPDMENNAFGLTADDPIEPNRVWYFRRPRATWSGPFKHPTAGVL